MKTAFTIAEIEEMANFPVSQVENLQYEIAMEKLEKVVEALEQEGTPLQLGLHLYEIGTALSKRCGVILDSTEARMIQLLGDGPQTREEPFDPTKDGR